MRISLTLSLLFISSVLLSQVRLGANIKVYQPMGDFNQHMGNIPAGISLSAMKQASSRFSWGGEIGVAMYTAGEYDYELSDEGRPGEYIEVYEDNCFWTAHAVARYSLFKTPAFEGYAEGRVGVTSFFTNQMALEVNDYFESKTRLHGTAFNSGFGFGLSSNVGNILSNDLDWLLVDFGVNVNSGSNTSYRNAPAISNEYSLEEGMLTSLTSYVGYRFGLIFEI